MTVYSQAYPFQLKGEPAELRVVRNQGFCWGEVSTLPEAKAIRIKDMQVEYHLELHDEDDDQAAEILISLVKRSFGDH